MHAINPINPHTEFGKDSINTFPSNDRKPSVTDAGHRKKQNPSGVDINSIRDAGSRRKTLREKQAISTCEWALCRLTLWFELESTNESVKGHKSCALQMVLRSNVQI